MLQKATIGKVLGSISIRLFLSDLEVEKWNKILFDHMPQNGYLLPMHVYQNIESE